MSAHGVAAARGPEVGGSAQERPLPLPLPPQVASYAEAPAPWGDVLERMAGEIQELRDRVEFLEPMYAATRRDAGESRAANAAIRKERDEAKAERDEAKAERDMYRGVAAKVPQLEAMIAQKDARIACMQQDLDHLVKVARRYVTGKVVYPAGPNEPPSEQKARRQGGGGGAGDKGGWTLPPRPRPRRTRVPKKPGGRKGHRGAGPSYRPTDMALHRFPRGPDGGIIAAPCQCGQCGGGGGGWRPDGFRPRIIRWGYAY